MATNGRGKDRDQEDTTLTTKSSAAAEQAEASIKSVQSLPDETFDGSSKTRWSKRKFRNKPGKIGVRAEERGKSASDAVKTKKSFGQQCRHFLNRLFRPKSREQTPVVKKRSASLTDASQGSLSSFDQFRNNFLNRSLRIKKSKPPIDVAITSPNNGLPPKPPQPSEEHRVHSSSFSTSASQASSVKSSSSPTPKAVADQSPLMKVVSICPTDGPSVSLSSTKRESDDCVVLSLTQSEVQRKQEDIKFVQSDLSGGGDFLKVCSSSVRQETPSPTQGRMKSPGYCVTVTPNNKSAYAVDYNATGLSADAARRGVVECVFNTNSATSGSYDARLCQADVAGRRHINLESETSASLGMPKHVMANVQVSVDDNHVGAEKLQVLNQTDRTDRYSSSLAQKIPAGSPRASEFGENVASKQVLVEKTFNLRADEANEGWNKLLNEAVKQLETDGLDAPDVRHPPPRRKTSQDSRPPKPLATRPGVESVVYYDLKPDNAHWILNNRSSSATESHQNAYISSDFFKPGDKTADSVFEEADVNVSYANFFSKEPLILYSRGSLQKSGDTLSPDSGISSVRSPASESSKSFSNTITTSSPTSHPPYEFLVPSSSSSPDWSEFNSYNRSYGKPPSSLRVTDSSDRRQNISHQVTTADRRLVNVVSPTPFVESHGFASLPRHRGKMLMDGESSFVHGRLPVHALAENLRTESSGSYKISPGQQMFDHPMLSRETNASFPSVPPPSYNSIIVKGDPADLARFNGQFPATYEHSPQPMIIRDPEKVENIYDLIPAAGGHVDEPSEGIYEQIPFHGFKEVGQPDKMAMMTIEPIIEHIEFSLKPVPLNIPRPLLNQSPSPISQGQNFQEENAFCVSPSFKPPLRDFRMNEEVQQELREKLKNIGHVDKFNTTGEEYLGQGGPSTVFFKSHRPETFSPVLVVQDIQDISPKNFEEQFEQEQLLSEFDRNQKRLDYENFMDIERQRKSLKERMEFHFGRHAHHRRGSSGDIVTPTGTMRRDIQSYNNVERPRCNKVTKYRGKARALFNFRAQKDRELSLRKGDIVYLLRRVDRNWFEGEHHNMTGIFPVTYVEVLESIEEAHSIARMREGSATVLHDFYPRSPIELPLKKGYIVTLIKRLDANWYEGRCGNRQGIFPVAYVSTIREPDTPVATPCATPVPTPSSSRIHTPLPGGPSNPGWQSPSAGSILSLNPEIPLAPRSPTMFSPDFSRESTPFGGSVICGPTYHPKRPSSVMSEPVRPREHRTMPHMVAKPKALTISRGPSCFDYRQLSSSSMGVSSEGTLCDSNSVDESHFSHDRVNPTHVAFQREGGPPATPYKRYQPPATFTSLRNPQDNYNDLRPTRKKTTKLCFAPIPERDPEADAIKPIIYPRYRALHDFKPRSPEELQLQKNEIVRVVEKCKDGWYIGFLESTRHFGLFPGNFVEPLRQ